MAADVSELQDNKWPLPLVAAGSFVVCWICYYCSRMASTALSNVYRAMAVDEKAAWDTRVVSTLHATVSFVGALWGLGNMLRDESAFFAANEAGAATDAAFIRGANYLMEVFLAISVGYFLQDFSVILTVRGAVWSVPDVVHHIVVMASMVACIITQTFSFYATWAMLGELSTPFLNLRYIFNKVGKPVPIVDYLFVAAFFASRPVNLTVGLAHCIVYYPYWSHIGVAYFQFGLGVTFAALQFYWAYLIILAVRDVFAVPIAKSPDAADTAAAVVAMAQVALSTATEVVSHDKMD